MSQIVFAALAEAARHCEPAALGIISRVKGSSPQATGAKALFFADGRIVGTLGGGCLEAEIQQRAIESLRLQQAATFQLVLDHDFGWDDGLICGGAVWGLILPQAPQAGERFWNNLAQRKTSSTWGVRSDFAVATAEPGALSEPTPAGQQSDWIYRETVKPQCALWIAGAGHVAQAVAPLAVQVDFEVSVFDDRPALANSRFFPPAVHLCVEVWEKLLQQLLPPVPSFGLIATRGHRHDALVLERWIHQPFSFIGMIGSTRKARTIGEHFLEQKLATEQQMRLVACPVGVKIRSQSVAEIAVSIIAQYIDKRAELAPRVP